MSDTPVEYQEQAGWREAERLRIKRTRRMLITALVILIILLLIASIALIRIFQPVGRIATTAEAKGVTWVRSIYGWGKSQDEQFWGPQGVAVGPDGTIWVTTQGQNRVVGFNPDGTPAAMLYQGPAGDPTNYPNSLSYPTAVAVDPAGLIYIADTPKSQVHVLDRDNQVIRTIFVPTPSAVAVSKDRLVVGSASGFVIMTPEGEVIKVVGKQGKGQNEFQGVRGVAIAQDGTIFVVDQYNNRVSSYDANGNRKWIISTGNAGNEKAVGQSIVSTVSAAPANMQIPAGMTIDGAGRLLIVDPFGFDITALDAKDGKVIAKYGSPGTVDGQFVYPSDIAYDPARDWFAVTDTQNARVQIIRLPDSGGSTLDSIARTLSGPIRACLVPLALIILAILAGIIYRIVQKRRQKKKVAAGATAGPEASPLTEPSSEQPV